MRFFSNQQGFGRDLRKMDECWTNFMEAKGIFDKSTENKVFSFVLWVLFGLPSYYMSVFGMKYYVKQID